MLSGLVVMGVRASVLSPLHRVTSFQAAATLAHRLGNGRVCGQRALIANGLTVLYCRT
jgi:hypothetical protein